jgi:hypothetical protein
MWMSESLFNALKEIAIGWFPHISPKICLLEIFHQTKLDKNNLIDANSNNSNHTPITNTLPFHLHSKTQKLVATHYMTLFLYRLHPNQG